MATSATVISAPGENVSETWWRRPGGGREVMQLALPLVVSSLSWTLLTFIDRIFLTWWSRDALAASFPAAMLWWTSMCFPLGVCMYVSTFVSQYYGSAAHKWIGPIVWQGVWIGVLATPVALLSLPLSEPIFRAAGHGPNVLQAELVYFRVLCLGTMAMLVSYAFSAFYSGQGRTWVVMAIDGGTTLTNIVLDYLWIFGHAGFPAGGIEGAAWATVVSLWLRVLVYLLLLVRRTYRAQFDTQRWQFDRRLTARLLYYGGPSGLQMFLEVVGFTAFVMLVGSLGVIELAATNLAFNVSSVAFMPVFGLATAVSILVGQYLGKGDPDLAARSTWTTMWISLVYMGAISTLYCLTPDLFLFGFFAKSTDADRHEIRALSIVLLRYVAAYNIFDALNLVFAHAIKGAGDTHFVFVVSFVMAIVLVTITWFGLRVLELRVYGSWYLVTGWVCLLGCIYWARFVQGAWRSMRVTEH